MGNIGARLNEEAERLGGISELAKQMRIARNTVYNWIEKENIPINKLLELGSIGADTIYILTGKRDISEGKLPPREEALLNNYRNSDEKNKKVIEQVALIAAKPQEIEDEEEKRKEA